MVKLVSLKRSAYSSAKISVKRGELYGEDKVKELSKLEFDELLRYLEEHGFRKSVDKSYLQYEGFYLIERVLNDHLSQIYSSVFMGADKKNRGFLEAYYLKYQVHNLMAIVRCKIANEKDFEAYLIGDSRRKEKYIKAFEMPNIEDAIIYMSKKLGFDEVNVLEAYKKGVYELENYLYKKYYSKLSTYKLRYNGVDEISFIKFIQEYVDLLNSRSFLRLKLEENKLDFNEIFLDGGKTSRDEFDKLKDKNITDCLTYFKSFFGEVDLSLDTLSVDSIDKKISLHKKKAQNLFRKAKFGSPFYLLRYLFKLEREISMLRILLKAKYLKLSETDIMELL